MVTTKFLSTAKSKHLYTCNAHYKHYNGVHKKKEGRKNVYLVKVESYRKEGKVKQRVIEYLGKEIDGKPVKKISG